jgi:hypothetical protein
MADHILYRFSDQLCRLLYVGRTVNLRGRLRCHEESKEWWSQVIDIHLEHFDTAEELDEAERVAIATEHPRYNIVGSARGEIASIGRRIDRYLNRPIGKSEELLYPYGIECGPSMLEWVLKCARFAAANMDAGRDPFWRFQDFMRYLSDEQRTI